jgi:hypothetical protein
VLAAGIVLFAVDARRNRVSNQRASLRAGGLEVRF